MTTSPFRFLDLPMIPQRLIMSFAKMDDVLAVSKCSKRSKALIKSLRLSISHISWQFRRDWYALFTYDRVNSRFLLDASSYPHGMTNPTLEVVNRVEVKAQKVESGTIVRSYGICDGWKYQVLEEYTRKVLELVRVHEFSLDASDDEPNGGKDLFVWKYFQPEATNFYYAVDGGKRLQESELLEIMATKTTSLVIWRNVANGVKYTGPLKMREFSVSGAHWLPAETILNMECVKFEMKEFRASGLPIFNQLLKNWVNGGLSQLRELTLKFALTEKLTPKLRKALFEGIKTFIGDMKIADHKCNCEEGCILKKATNIRSVNGKIAGVKIDKLMIKFLVWDQ